MVPMAKQKKLRNLEYYGLQASFDKLYQQSQNGVVFCKLMDLIRSEENIRLRYLNKFPLCPISYIQTKAPLYKPKGVCKYTESGRAKIHENLKFNVTVMLMLMREKYTNGSIEFTDNRLSLWAAQYGKCAITGKVLWIDEIHCHHKVPLENGGTDRYKNLVIVHRDVHILIHATQPETIQVYLDRIGPTQTMLKKINKYRMMAGNTAI